MTDTESDTEPDSSPNRAAPQTPPRSTKAFLQTWSSSHQVSTTPKSSPPASPSLSLHSLGMSPFSSIRRQFPSHFARSPSSLHETERSEQEDLVQDSKDVLVQRLNDLAAQLMRQDYLKEENVYSLHTKVDEMERALSTREHPSRRTLRRSRPTSLALPNSSSSARDSLWGSLTPGRIVPSISNVPLSSQRSTSTQTDESLEGARIVAAEGSRISRAQADQIVAEAQNLSKELEGHIHEMLIMRAERAAQRIIYLEKRVRELESERNEGEMEMLNLQIQLKAIEVQCLSYIPKDADEELRESISAWKTEWSTLKRKRARRKAGTGEGEDPGIQGTPTRQPRNMASPG
ncbi:uncharacterized protein F4822DRAFT_429343 [Hypoxylon trugodes]|uniref:uncharacterized protein n=1 Tax=Hypoxylon trugodes TaxID=326681 RepID=UPI002193FD7E|nr:uncharacterized protein F4822DRAFT_429343 [Hypoxylon trugodes]KAI1388727.1 hypothetical protein F4822DRAFT_429343 [Hypoxylon trugodes]